MKIIKVADGAYFVQPYSTATVIRFSPTLSNSGATPNPDSAEEPGWQEDVLSAYEIENEAAEGVTEKEFKRDLRAVRRDNYRLALLLAVVLVVTFFVVLAKA